MTKMILFGKYDAVDDDITMLMITVTVTDKRLHNHDEDKDLSE